MKCSTNIRINFKRYACVALILLFASFAYAIEHNEFVLSKQQLDEYNANGILVVRNFFTTQEIGQLRKSADRLQAVAREQAKQNACKLKFNGTEFLTDRDDKQLKIYRIVWIGAADPEMLSLGRQPKLLIPVSQLLETNNANHLLNQVNFKLANDAADKFDWHQDIKNRRALDANWQNVNQDKSFVQTIIIMDDMDIEKGTVFYIPGSHKRGDLYLDQIQDPKELNRVGELDKAIPMTLYAGDLVFMHQYLVHGNEPNKTDHSLCAFINGFSYPEANSKPYPGEGSAQRITLK